MYEPFDFDFDNAKFIWDDNKAEEKKRYEDGEYYDE